MRSHSILIYLLALLVIPNILKAQDCAPLDPRQHVFSEKTVKDIAGAAQTVFRIGRVEGSYTSVVEKEVKNLYDKYPRADKIVLNDKLIYMFCTILQKSGYNNDKKLEELNKFIITIHERLPKGTEPQQGGGSLRECNLSEELSTAQWIFQVCNISETNEYAERYYHKQNIIRPKGGNDTLIIIDARLKNLLQRTQSPVLTERQPGNTGLIDDRGYSYQPIDYDARQRIDKIMSYEGAPLIPGTIMDFALVFSVPRGTKPKLLVFTLSEYHKLSQGTDVQISLTK